METQQHDLANFGALLRYQDQCIDWWEARHDTLVPELESMIRGIPKGYPTINTLGEWFRRKPFRFVKGCRQIGF